MKRLISAVLLAALLSLLSCEAEPSVNYASNDKYIYFEKYRLNCETGNITPLCGDPLCEHNTDDCLFSKNTRTTPVYSTGGKVFFFQLCRYIGNQETGSEDEYRLLAYNVADQSAEAVFEFNISNEKMKDISFLAEGNIFMQIETNDADDESGDTPVHKVFRYNIESNEVSEDYPAFDYSYNIFSYKDGTLYLSKDILYYRLNADGTCEEVTRYETGKGVEDDGRLYYYDSGSLYRQSSASAKPERIIEGLAKQTDFKYYQGNIYFLRDDGNNSSGKKLYRVPASKPGSEPELLYDPAGSLRFSSYYTDYAGKYYTVMCTRLDENGNDADHRSIFIIDIETLETKTVDY